MSASWSSVRCGFAMPPFRGTSGSAAIVQRCHGDVWPVSDFPKVRRSLYQRCKRLISGDDVTTGAGHHSQITASIRVTAISRLLSVCRVCRDCEERNEQNAHQAIVCSHAYSRARPSIARLPAAVILTRTISIIRVLARTCSVIAIASPSRTRLVTILAVTPWAARIASVVPFRPVSARRASARRSSRFMDRAYFAARLFGGDPDQSDTKPLGERRQLADSCATSWGILEFRRRKATVISDSVMPRGSFLSHTALTRA